MKKKFLLPVLLLTTVVASAQFVRQTAVNAQLGYALTQPHFSEAEIADQGFMLQGEYVMKIASWVQIKPYASFFLTHSNGRDIYDRPTTERAETTAVMLGGKARLRAPIPWVAPYLELGLGTSIGQFETITAFTDIDRWGAIYHIPFALGLELGPQHQVDLGFSYYFLPTVEQIAGAFAIGVSIPLRS